MEQAGLIRDQILDAAKDLFFTQGYGPTSIEAIAARARISKRTFYDRFKDKSEVFQAVVHRVVQNLRPPDMSSLFEGKNSEEVLLRLAKLTLHAILTPEALAMHRLILAEANRFPELALMASAEGTRQKAVMMIAAFLQNRFKDRTWKIDKLAFAAEQFLQMVISLPQRRALGLGDKMTQSELDQWAADSVRLFLNGIKSL